MAVHDQQRPIEVPMLIESHAVDTAEIAKNNVKISRVSRIKKDEEYDVDFDDTRSFSVSRWRDIINSTEEDLSKEDLAISRNYRSWQEVVSEIQTKLTDPASTTPLKHQMKRVQALPRALLTLFNHFAELAAPFNVQFDIVWVLFYLNLKFSYTTPERLKRTAEVFEKIRRSTELFNRCLKNCDENNEALIALVDYFEPMVTIFMDSLKYLHECSSDRAADTAWPDLNEAINDQLATLDTTVRHLNEIVNYSKANMEGIIKNMSQRLALNPDDEETAKFPLHKLPGRATDVFYGREEELAKIEDYLKPGEKTLRTYTIYGKRGVGKTEIALQFARQNTSYDAIFWIQCETSVSIRQSFSDVAVALNLPGADRDGRHEENLLAVHKWLKKTQKRWLLIFDNAEREQTLRAYWPMGASGAILITSRRYYNFLKDVRRRGDTVKPFNFSQSWALLMELLGKQWQQSKDNSEQEAAMNILKRLEGLALAIQQAAVLIKDPEIGGRTVSKTYEMFSERIRTLPKRHSSARSSSETALDALWDMTFNALSRNARALLGVLAWLSPDLIRMELFMPDDQAALDGPLSFCKQDAHVSQGQASALHASAPSIDCSRAIEELAKMRLVKVEGITMSIHRVVQEAVSFHDADDLQINFDVATRLVYEAFPKLNSGRSLYEEWNVCREYITHGVNLSKKFSDHIRSATLKSSKYLVQLLASCAWYLYEVGEFDLSAVVCDTGKAACEEKDSISYASLLNIDGGRFLDLNRLSDCRKAWESVLRIRKERLPLDHVLVAASYHNLGNLETAMGNYPDALDYYNRAILIWNEGGQSVTLNLALTYLCWGRAHMLNKNLAEARALTRKAEFLFMKNLRSDKGSMANVHYAYGNIEFRENNFHAARQSWESCLKIALAEMPIHPLTIGAYYSLAGSEMALNHPELAKGFLDKAKIIAELRSPTREDGPLTRILWRTSKLMESDMYGNAKDAAEYRARAELAKQKLTASGEGGLIQIFNDEDAEREEEQYSYDALVPLFYR